MIQDKIYHYYQITSAAMGYIQWTATRRFMPSMMSLCQFHIIK